MARDQSSCALGKSTHLLNKCPTCLALPRPLTRICSNGGAGAVGLIAVLANDYLSTHHQPGSASITWVCNHSRNTQLALLQHHIDIALTYERDQEQLAETEGWSKTIGCIFHDHFVLAGPVSDPADIMQQDLSLVEALRLIAAKKSLFHSRADSSATMWKERGRWQAAGLEPWKDAINETWYKQSLHSPAGAVIEASKAGAYLITDRSTLLHQTQLGLVKDMTVFYEPQNEDDVLMNSCYALVSTSQVEGDAAPGERDRFVRYMLSARGQAVVRRFGKVQDGDVESFAVVDDGFARNKMKGGHAVDGRWQGN
jgi:ABC-type tungstate transport system permease subunit